MNQVFCDATAHLGRQRQTEILFIIAQKRTPDQRKKWCVYNLGKIDSYDDYDTARAKYDTLTSQRLMAYLMKPDI